MPVVLSFEHMVLERWWATRVLLLADVAFKAVGFPRLSVRFETSIPRLEAFAVKLSSISASVAVASSVVIPKTSRRYSGSSSLGGLATVPTRWADDNDTEVNSDIFFHESLDDSPSTSAPVDTADIRGNSEWLPRQSKGIRRRQRKKTGVVDM